MLDSNLIEQLKQVFSKLESTIELQVAQSQHLDQSELLELVHQLCQVSSKLKFVQREESSPVPLLKIAKSHGPSGISFRGVPGGHEFSSLVLAILHTDGKGKLPDIGLSKRIQGIRGPVHVKTYVSLTCENCPEIVQALNLMATLHPAFEHQMVDGAVAQSEVEALGLQGVPAVVVEGKLIHSGKAQLLDLIEALEAHYGVNAQSLGGQIASQESGEFDVIVIGGGPAGASAAIYSARKGLKTAIIAERFGGQLQETKGIENMIGQSYTEGAKLAAQLSVHVGQYPVQIFEHRRVQKVSEDLENIKFKKKLELTSGEVLRAGSVIVATGAKWRELGIPGEKEHVGRGVAYCAHCDGPFFKEKRVAVVGGGNSGVEAALDLAGIASEVTLIEYSDQLKADEVLVNKLKDLPNAKVITNAKTTQVIGDGAKVVGLEYQDRKTQTLERLDLDGIFVQIGLLPNSQFLKGVVELTPQGEIVVDGKGRTSVSGIYAAGDVTTIPFKQIVIAMGDGARVALSAFEDRMRA